MLSNAWPGRVKSDGSSYLGLLTSDAPNDIDVAVFQESKAPYLELAMKYRRMLRPVFRKIAVDVIPVRPKPEQTSFLGEIEAGEVVYER